MDELSLYKLEQQMPILKYNDTTLSGNIFLSGAVNYDSSSRTLTFTGGTGGIGSLCGLTGDLNFDNEGYLTDGTNKTTISGIQFDRAASILNTGSDINLNITCKNGIHFDAGNQEIIMKSNYISILPPTDLPNSIPCIGRGFDSNRFPCGIYFESIVQQDLSVINNLNLQGNKLFFTLTGDTDYSLSMYKTTTNESNTIYDNVYIDTNSNNSHTHKLYIRSDYIYLQNNTNINEAYIDDGYLDNAYITDLFQNCKYTKADGTITQHYISNQISGYETAEENKYTAVVYREDIVSGICKISGVVKCLTSNNITTTLNMGSVTDFLYPAHNQDMIYTVYTDNASGSAQVTINLSPIDGLQFTSTLHSVNESIYFVCFVPKKISI